MIEINKIYIKQIKEKSRCICEIEINKRKKEIWFEVDNKYEQYLVTDRADAIIIGILNYALRKGEDIISKLPVTDELLYNLREILMPSLLKNSYDLHKIEIKANTITPIKSGEHIGTGCSCGVDSFYSIKMHSSNEYKSIKITDLCINNVGAFNECYKEYGMDKTKVERYKKTENVAKELGINLIETDSNFSEVIPQEHLLTHTYSSCFAIYMLQKYWKTYFYASSGYDFSAFNLKNNDLEDCAEYELLSLQAFSTSAIRIYSDGGARKKKKKTKELGNFSIAQKNLHVCINKPINCGVCPKCMRTILALDALNMLDDFKMVFDIEYYYKNKNIYYKWLWKQHILHDKMNEETYQIIKKRNDFHINIFLKIKNIPYVFIKNILPSEAKQRIKKFLKK